MESHEKEIPKPWVKKESKRNPGTPYYLNLETFERSWTFPTEDFKKKEDPDNKTGVFIEAAPVIVEDIKCPTKVGNKRQNRESSYKELPCAEKEATEEASRKKLRVDDGDESSKIIVKRKKRNRGKRKGKGKEIPSLPPTELDTGKADCPSTDEKDFSKSNVCTLVSDVSDDKPTRSDKDGGKLESVNLLDSNRKPIKFTLNNIFKDKIDTAEKAISEKNANTGKSKSKPTLHPSILAFQKLANTVKWSKSSPPIPKKGSLLTPAIKSKAEETERNKQTNILKTTSSISSEGRETCFKLSGFRIPKKKLPETKSTKLLEGLIDLSYGSSDEEETKEQSELEGRDKKPSIPKISKNYDRYVDDNADVKQEKQPICGDRDSGYKINLMKRGLESSRSISPEVKFKKKEQAQQKQKQPLFTEILKDEEFKSSEDSGTHTPHQEKIDQNLSDILKNNEETIQLRKELDEEEFMEVEIQEIISEIATFRGNANLLLHDDKKSVCTDFDKSTNFVYYVVDTNVLLCDLKFLEKLKTREIDGKPVVIVIPYIVLQELDGLKKRTSVGNASQRAITWCNKYFENKDTRVVGQNYDDYLVTLSHTRKSSADDLIRDCCLLMKTQSLDVRLLTNDTNLRNKSLVSAISATSVEKLKLLIENSKEKSFTIANESCELFEICELRKSSPSPETSTLESMVVTLTKTSCPQEIPKLSSRKLEKFPRKANSSDGQNSEKYTVEMLNDIEVSLSKTLGQILEAVFVDAYGHDLWKQIIIHKPPWTLREILNCWHKHWIAVFNDKFDFKVKDLIADMSKLLKVAHSENDIRTLLQQTKCLYAIIEKTDYKDHLVPLQPKALDVASDCTMKETKAEIQESAEPEEFTSLKPQQEKGFSNVKEMINLVGVYITHFLAMILDGCGAHHDLPRLNSKQITREDAYCSAVNLRDVIMRLGIGIVK
ncbi:transcriptional protein SWT1 [Palaemon carinicauda]|uniref:transcriptional protein SWT1 n=1 Tax=Palaemon carinicauda TaxID=392227 RepID=UPI0035B58340